MHVPSNVSKFVPLIVSFLFLFKKVLIIWGIILVDFFSPINPLEHAPAALKYLSIT